MVSLSESTLLLAQGPVHSFCIQEGKLSDVQNKTVPSAGDPNSLQSRGDATARVSAAEAPREQSSTHRPDRVLRSLQSKTKQDSKQALDYVREWGTLFVLNK